MLLQPNNMTIHLGDRVTSQDAYRSPRLPCNYVPNLITGDRGPVPPLAQPSVPSAILAAAPTAEVAKETGRPQSLEESQPSNDECALRLPYNSARYAEGVVTRELPPELALASIARDEAKEQAKVERSYIDLKRVVVTVNAQANPIVTVPAGMTVKIGDRVGLQEARRSRTLPCGWVPNLITDDFGPKPHNLKT